MQVEGYDIDIVVQGFPGKSVCHGGLGWSTVPNHRTPDSSGGCAFRATTLAGGFGGASQQRQSRL